MIIEFFRNKSRSVLFRVIILISSIVIIETNENYFNKLLYYLCFIPYIIIFSKTLFKEGLSSILRLINDYFFIALVIAGKNLDFEIVSFCLLPIINNPNHEGKKRNWLVFLLTSALVFHLNHYQINSSLLSLIVLFFAIYLIGLMVDSRFRLFTSAMELSKQVDEFLESSLDLDKSELIYDGIIKILNNVRGVLFYKANFEDILCFRISESKVEFINSSLFVWEYNIKNEEIVRIVNEKDTEVSRIDFSINGVKNEGQNIAITHSLQNSTYLFIITFRDGQTSDVFDSHYCKILKPTLARVSNFLELKKNLGIRERDFHTKMTEKYFYVQNAVKAMHFIRNKSSPIDNFIAMSSDLTKGRMDSSGKEIYEDELKKVRTNFKEILEKADFILEKSVNPFSSIDLVNKSVPFIFDKLRSNWTWFFDQKKIKVKIDSPILIDKETLVNTNGITIVFTDWISNISKHSIGNEEVLFELNENFIKIEFLNEVQKNDLNNAKKLIADFRSNNRGEILKRRSYGIVMIKSLLEEMNISGNMEFRGNLLVFSLTFELL